jgi:hypothetical protein
MKYLEGEIWAPGRSNPLATSRTPVLIRSDSYKKKT